MAGIKAHFCVCSILIILINISEAVKAGNCPADRVYQEDPHDVSCSTDENCDGSMKCCPKAGRLVCRPIDVVIVGECPKTRSTIRKSKCDGDLDCCAQGKKCCPATSGLFACTKFEGPKRASRSEFCSDIITTASPESTIEATTQPSCVTGAEAPPPDPENNLALNKATFQSSDFKQGPAPCWYSRFAVDGNRNADYYNGCSCSHTAVNQAGLPWWAVDLGSEVSVARIVVVNRGDCCPERMNNFEVLLTNTSPAVTPPNALLASDYNILARYPGYPQEGVPTIVCSESSVPGRYLVIRLPQEGILTICEAEVYGFA